MSSITPPKLRRLLRNCVLSRVFFPRSEKDEFACEDPPRSFCPRAGNFANRICIALFFLPRSIFYQQSSLPWYVFITDRKPCNGVTARLPPVLGIPWNHLHPDGINSFFSILPGSRATTSPTTETFGRPSTSARGRFRQRIPVKRIDDPRSSSSCLIHQPAGGIYVLLASLGDPCWAVQERTSGTSEVLVPHDSRRVERAQCFVCHLKKQSFPIFRETVLFSSSPLCAYRVTYAKCLSAYFLLVP